LKLEPKGQKDIYCAIKKTNNNNNNNHDNDDDNDDIDIKLTSNKKHNTLPVPQAPSAGLNIV
jgi:hypothetical protein